MRPEDTSENADMCICPDCPTYNDCMAANDEKLYCSRGKSACAVTAVDCICGDCPVWRSYDLDAYYFCIRGAAT